jgi:hypothetical protein
MHQEHGEVVAAWQALVRQLQARAHVSAISPIHNHRVHLRGGTCHAWRTMDLVDANAAGWELVKVDAVCICPGRVAVIAVEVHVVCASACQAVITYLVHLSAKDNAQHHHNTISIVLMHISFHPMGHSTTHAHSAMN